MSRKVTPAGGSILSDIRDFKQHKIVETAQRLFYQKGYSRTTLEEVAKALGTTKPFIYAQFKSKDALLAKVSVKGLEASLAVSERAVARDEPPPDQLRWLVREFTKAVIDHEQNIAIFFREEKHLDPATLAHVRAMQKTFDRNVAQILRRGTELGDFDIADIRAATLAIGGIVSWIYTWHRPTSRLGREALAEKMTDLVLRMVEVRACA